MYHKQDLMIKSQKMKILIIGGGRMGIRHAIGISTCDFIDLITIVDISEESLEIAKEQLCKLDNYRKFSFHVLEYLSTCKDYDIGILATTAQNRITLCKQLVIAGCKSILIEKPLGQSFQEVLELIAYTKTIESKVYVNLNMRLYPDFVKLKKDLNSKNQFSSPRTITINTGSLGIGANGIHYLDYLIFLYDADEVRVIDSFIDEETIPSARGMQFSDFGGWCLLEFFQNMKSIGKSFLSISSRSTVFGGWDILCTHGRITINESNGKRVDYLRKDNSTMPMNRYHADYLEPVISDFASPFLGDLTKFWVESIYKGNSLLPEIENTILPHKIMFEWLAKSKLFTNIFPIT